MDLERHDKDKLIIFQHPECALNKGAATRCVSNVGSNVGSKRLANMERMLRPMLVVRAAGYTMRQIAQH